MLPLLGVMGLGFGEGFGVGWGVTGSVGDIVLPPCGCVFGVGRMLRLLFDGDRRVGLGLLVRGAREVLASGGGSERRRAPGRVRGVQQ